MIRKTPQLKPRSPVSVDLEIGKRIRTRRLEMKISKPQLASVIGVSFHQLYKYENGTDRINANRLSLIASALKVRPETFFQADDVLADVTSLIDVTDTNMLRVLRAWSKIEDQATQRELVVLTELIAASTVSNN